MLGTEARTVAPTATVAAAWRLLSLPVVSWITFDI
ncbi:MAG: hypothetical protein QOH12_2115, partial [Solirubrobacteraceae bacterium]|nr:hypothetical protein [Solirubrobacteraceae bacterium]